MAPAADSETSSAEALFAYKELLSEIIGRRPSGTRQRLAAALAKNRSFVSQISNPAYATPIPAVHLEAIFDVCHFSAAEKRNFLMYYGRAHPKRHSPLTEHGRKPRAVSLPDLGDEARNAKLHALVSGFVRNIAALMDHEPSKGKRR
jgi:hypothetical protein